MSSSSKSSSRWWPLVVASACVWGIALMFATPQTPLQAAPLPASHEGPLFTHSDNCVACHNNLTTPSGEDVSIGATWRSTMMANSARDPYFQASVRRETIDHARHAEDIQDECATCHMPIAQRMAKAAGKKAALFPFLPMSNAGDSEEHALAADGVSCTVCHQIGSEKLGTAESFNGNFTLRPARADGIREIFGPFAVDPGRRRIMRSVTGFEQVEGAHIRQSEVCATCHTLTTQAFGPDGSVVGSLPEQMNYQEWLHSDFAKEQRSCQSCHMPAAKGPIRVSSVLGDYRDSMSRHVFVGGNAFMVRMLNRYRVELGVQASPTELEATARATLSQLATDTATIAVERAATTVSDVLMFDVAVTNLTGHKFPTGYPARRTWLHVTVRDRQGRVVFESGAVDDQGRIAGNDHDRDVASFEPHYEQITTSDQVQIYEAILGDPASKPTTGLLTATQYLKDNRLLPRGFDKATAGADVAVHGGAFRDTTFAGGGDRVSYRVAAPAAGAPYTIDAELLYQPISYRWASNLATYDAPEPKQFVGYYRALSSAASAIVARATGRTDR